MRIENSGWRARFAVLIFTGTLLATVHAEADCGRRLLSAIRSGSVRFVDTYLLVKTAFTDPGFSLRGYFVLYPRARALARELGLDAADFANLAPKAQFEAFNARAGREMNARGMAPLTLLRRETSDPRVLALIDGIEARARARGLTIKWQENEKSESSLGEKEIFLFVDAFVGRTPIAESLMILDHELNHDVEIGFGGRGVTEEAFVNEHLDAILRDEIRVRRAERATFAKLRELGLAYPRSMVASLSREMWDL